MQDRPLDPIQQKRAMEDPEVVAIVQDPAMNQVLQEMQRDPKAAMKYLQDPIVQDKLNTLIYAGVVRMKYSVCLKAKFELVVIYLSVEGNRRYTCIGRKPLYREV